MKLLVFRCLPASFKFGLSLQGNEFECLISFLEATNLRKNKTNNQFISQKEFALNTKLGKTCAVLGVEWQLH